MKKNRILAAVLLASGLLLSVLPTSAKAAGAVCSVTNGEHIIKERTVIAATCVKSGIKQMYCSACDEVLVDNITIPATGVHTEVSIPGREATCKEEGLTEGKKCSVCGEILVAQQTVAKKSHTEVEIPAVAPTCTQDGLTAGKKCSVCGEILAAQQKDPAKGHTEVKIPGKEATCTETGLTEGVKCSVCGEILTAQNVIDKKVHDYQKGVCTVCGEKDPAYTPAPTPTTAPTTAPAASTKGLDNVPKTGDVMPVAVLGVLAILGMGAVLVKKAFSVR